jgi:hypothetical protein
LGRRSPQTSSVAEAVVAGQSGGFVAAEVVVAGSRDEDQQATSPGSAGASHRSIVT